MSIHSYRIFCFVALLLATSCELIVDVDVPYEGDKVVVNAIQRPDSTWYVDLSLTKNIVGPDYGDYLQVNKANVVITNPDGLKETLEFKGNGLFRGSSRPEAGKKYHINVEPNGLAAVEAEMTMPAVVPIIDVEWDSSEVDTGHNSFFSNVPFTVTFDDPSESKNFYTVQVYSLIQSENYSGDGSPPNIFRFWRAREVNIENDPGIATEDDYVDFFGDDTFNGRTYVAHFTNQFVVQPNEKLLEVRVLLISMSEESFKYQTSRDLQDQVMGDPFAQPVPIYSNMSNGFGIFAGNSMDVKTWKY